MIRQGISAKPEKDSKIVTITYLSAEPALAASIVNAVVKAYVDQLFEMKMSYSRYAIEWMTGQAREEGARLEQAERNLQSFMKANDIIGMESRVGVSPERISELGLELTRAETRRRELEAVYQRLAAIGERPVCGRDHRRRREGRGLRRREDPAAQGGAEPGRTLEEIRRQAPGHGRSPARRSRISRRGRPPRSGASCFRSRTSWSWRPRARTTCAGD